MFERSFFVLASHGVACFVARVLVLHLAVAFAVYVFYDTVLVGQDCHLQIEAGSNLYFDSKAALLIGGKMSTTKI